MTLSRVRSGDSALPKPSETRPGLRPGGEPSVHPAGGAAQRRVPDRHPCRPLAALAVAPAEMGSPTRRLGLAAVKPTPLKTSSFSCSFPQGVRGARDGWLRVCPEAQVGGRRVLPLPDDGRSSAVPEGTRLGLTGSSRTLEWRCRPLPMPVSSRVWVAVGSARALTVRRESSLRCRRKLLRVW